MGLFSKKTYICPKCGKEYTTRIDTGLCDDCLLEKMEIESQEKQERKELEYLVKGYKKYNKANTDTKEKIYDIVARRTAILEKYQPVDGISRSELQDASDNYRQLTEQQALDILRRVQNCELVTTYGASFGLGFFVLTQGQQIVVDAMDVFAVAMSTSVKIQHDGKEAIVCGVFTNDPYIPMFTLVLFGDIGFFELTKSKSGRENVQKIFTQLCPNLTYAVQDVKKLDSIIKKEGAVRGNIPLKEMRSRLSDLYMGKTDFGSEKKMETAVHDAETVAMLEQYQFLLDTDVSAILKMDKMFNRNYWNKQLIRLQEIDG